MKKRPDARISGDEAARIMEKMHELGIEIIQLRNLLRRYQSKIRRALVQPDEEQDGRGDSR